LPTAVQAVLSVHETAESIGNTLPLGFGVERTDHAVPFQDSPRVNSVLDLL
jgi:hypothetical protein